MSAYVTRDGEIVSPILDNENKAFEWLLRHQGQSVSYATTHGGYAIVTVEDPEPETMTTAHRFSLLGVLVAIILGGVVDHGALETPGGDIAPVEVSSVSADLIATYDSDGRLIRSPSSPVCFEDEIRLVIIGEVLPNDDKAPAVDWGRGENTGREICIPADNLNLGGN